MDEPTKKIPDGLLADAVLKSEAILDAPVMPNPADTPSPAVLPKDANYFEPTPLPKFRETADAISRDADEACTLELIRRASLQRKVLIDFMLSRIDVLERALKPFCITGTMLSNAAMCLAAIGRGEEPAGGTWISNPPDSVSLQPTAGYFYGAIDAFGRAATEAHMESIFKRVQAANVLQAEKTKHVEDGGTVH